MASTPIRVVVAGVGGRMGSALVRLLQASRSHVVVGGTERAASPLAGTDLGGVPVSEDLGAVVGKGRAQVVIDFTAPEATVAHAQACARAGVAMVIGTTGLEETDRAKVARAAAKIPVVMSPNMSIGVNVMFQAAADLASALGESFEVEILEAHHRMKKDAPSGTALKLADQVASALGRDSKAYQYARHGVTGARPQKQIGIQALRGGDVVGEHTVFFFGDGERLELTHRATSRDQFAQGALRAAQWVVGQSPGLYEMADVLGLGKARQRPTRSR